MRRACLLAVIGTAAIAVTSIAAQSAGAYGGQATYQVTFSLNCDNRSSAFCTSVVGLGGEWGWFAFNPDGTVDAQLTFCSHEGQNGAFHASVDGIWKIGAPTDPPVFGQSADFLVSTDGGKTWQDTDIPGAAGHYSAKMGPGISAEAQVAAAPH
jgi:hypothetical protein